MNKTVNGDAAESGSQSSDVTGAHSASTAPAPVENNLPPTATATAAVPEPAVEPAAEVQPAPESAVEPAAAVPVVPKSAVVQSIGVLGTVDRLSEAEDAEYQGCQAVIMMGSRSFVEMGQAFGRIRDLRLYRQEFDSFDAYCRLRWQYGRAYVYRIIAAAELLTSMSSNCRQVRPDHESQVRPLIGLTLDQAGQAWDKAVEMAGGRRITAARVKAAMKALELRVGPAPANKVARQKRKEQRRLIDETISHLLMLASQRADAVLLEKLETLHGHVRALLG